MLGIAVALLVGCALSFFVFSHEQASRKHRATDAPYGSGPSKNLDKSQESEGTLGHSRYRWDVLVAAQKPAGQRGRM